MSVDKHKDSKLPAEVIEQRIAFRDHLSKFRRLQRHFQPEVIPVLASQDILLSATTQDGEDDIQNTPLLLPSSLSQDILAKTSPKLIRMERDLRLGQCQDALSQLRHHLHSRARILKDKYVNVRHQIPNTRSRSLLDRVSTKIDALASKYKTAYASLLVLDSDVNAKWRSELQPLHQHDIRSMAGDDLMPSNSTQQSKITPGCSSLPGGIPSEGNRTVSWIWRGALDDDWSTPGFHECVYSTMNSTSFSDYPLPAFRIEWSKARARSERWREEVMILQEEMRRTLVSLRFFSELWTARGAPSNLVLLSKDPIVREGLTAYADYQSHIFASLRRRFHLIWSGLENGDGPVTEAVPTVSDEALMELQGGDI